jgi:hypothetical protein
MISRRNSKLIKKSPKDFDINNRGQRPRFHDVSKIRAICLQTSGDTFHGAKIDNPHL